MSTPHAHFLIFTCFAIVVTPNNPLSTRENLGGKHRSAKHVNNVQGIREAAPTTIDDDRPNYWFPSLCCPEDIPNPFTLTPGKSAFSLYERSSASQRMDAASAEQINAPLYSKTFDDDNDSLSSYDECDVVASYGVPLIARTYSFDDGNDEDDYPTQSRPPSPSFFRFDRWSCNSSSDAYSTGSVYTTPFNALPNGPVQQKQNIQTKPRYCLGVTLQKQSTFDTQYCNSSSTRAIIPPSNSFTFQPIRDGSGRLSLDTTSASPTMSMCSGDPFAFGPESHTDGHGSSRHALQCPGIPRVATDEQDEELFPCPPISTVHFNEDDNLHMYENDEISPSTYSSPTDCYNPPIPDVIFVVHKKPKSWRRKILQSLHLAVTLGRAGNHTGRNSRFKKRCNSKGRLGEF